jgi:phage baseplate assembly protein V
LSAGINGADAPCCSAARYNSPASHGRESRASVPAMREDDIPGQLGELIRHGRIETVDLPAGRITVKLGDIETQPIRFFTGGAGGTRVWSRPKVGEQVTLLAPGGDIEGAIAMRGMTCDAFPHLGDEARELVQFEDGAIIAYNPESHALEAVLPSGATVTVTAPGGVTINADVTINGDVTVNGKIDASDDVKAGDISLQHHKHPDVQAGAAKTGEPE